jgi:hypothetical protein
MHLRGLDSPSITASCVVPIASRELVHAGDWSAGQVERRPDEGWKSSDLNRPQNPANDTDCTGSALRMRQQVNKVGSMQAASATDGATDSALETYCCWDAGRRGSYKRVELSKAVLRRQK